MGPLVTRQHRDKVASYIEIAEQDGATVVVDGRTVAADQAELEVRRDYDELHPDAEPD